MTLALETPRREEWAFTRKHMEAALERLGIETPLEQLREEYAAGAQWHWWRYWTEIEKEGK